MKSGRWSTLVTRITITKLMSLTSKETNKRAGAICVRPSYFLHHPSYIIAPMHDVVPSAVSAAVKMDITT